MRKIYLLALYLLSLPAFSQVPHAINYQGVARNLNGNPIVGPIAVKVDIHKSAFNGSVVCSETFNVNTNQFGIFDLRIGTASPGQFASIQWGTDIYFVGVSIDNGAGFGAEITNQQMVSVPYALYAKTAGSSGPASTVISTSDAINILNAPPYFIVNYNPPTLQLVSDTVLSIKQGTYTSAPVILKAGVSTTATPMGLWTGSSSSIYLSNPSNNVGIGAVPSFAKLDVISTGTTGVFVSSPATGIFAVTTSNSPSITAIAGNNQGGNLSGPGISGTSSSSLAAGVQGVNSGPGPGVYGVHQNNMNSPTAHGVYGETNSSSPVTAGVIGVNNNIGPGVYGYQSLSNGGPGVWGIGNSSVSAAIHGINNNGYASVFGDNGTGNGSASAYGVWGRTNSTNSLVSGVHGQNTGAGNGVHGLATSTTILVAGTSGLNTGFGVGLKGSLPPTTTGGASNAALLIENGHLWATSVFSPSISNPFNMSGVTINGASLTPGSNDVRGMITLTVQSGTAPWNINGYVEITLNFNKPYMPGGPWVVVTKYDATPMSCEIVNMATTFVTFRIKNPLTAVTAPNSTVLKFNYMVMQ